MRLVNVQLNHPQKLQHRSMTHSTQTPSNRRPVRRGGDDGRPLTIEGHNYFFSDADDGFQCQQGMPFEIVVIRDWELGYLGISLKTGLMRVEFDAGWAQIGGGRQNGVGLLELSFE